MQSIIRRFFMHSLFINHSRDVTSSAKVGWRMVTASLGYSRAENTFGNRITKQNYDDLKNLPFIWLSNSTAISLSVLYFRSKDMTEAAEWRRGAGQRPTARARSNATSDDAIAQPRRAPVAAASVARTPLPGRLRVRLRVDVRATYAADVRRTVCQQQPQQHRRRRARLSCVHRASSNGLRQLQHFPICLADVTAPLSCGHRVTAIQRSSDIFFTKYRPTEFVKRRYTQSARSASKMLTAIG